MVKKTIISIVLLVSKSHAATVLEGTLNPLFGSYGQSTIGVLDPQVYDTMAAVAEKATDATGNEPVLSTKYFVAGSSATNIALISVLQDGTADNTFGNQGVAIDTRYTISTANTGAARMVSEVIVDNQIFVAATNDADGHILVIPYNMNGTPSSSNLALNIDLGAPGIATGIAVGKNVKQRTLVVIANVGNVPYLIFIEGNTPRIVATTLPFDALFNDIKIQNDGKIVVAGLQDVGGVTQILVARFLQTGLLDTTFGNGTGYQTTTVGTNARASTLAIQGDGKILATGRNSDNDTILARYTQDGKIDASFGTAGVTTFDITSLESVRVSLQDDGKILVSGTVTAPTNRFYSIRFDQSGATDSSFSGLGIVPTAVFDQPSQLGGITIPATAQTTNTNNPSAPSLPAPKVSISAGILTGLDQVALGSLVIGHPISTNEIPA